MPTKLVKLASNILSTSLATAINNSPHDLLLAKLAVYGVDESFLCYIYSYLLNRKQCMQINNINSDFLNVILGVPQGSIVGSILFNSLMHSGNKKVTHT